MKPREWTPDQPLRHDASNRQIERRAMEIRGTDQCSRMALVVREFASACMRAKFAACTTDAERTAWLRSWLGTAG